MYLLSATVATLAAAALPDPTALPDIFSAFLLAAVTFGLDFGNSIVYTSSLGYTIVYLCAPCSAP